MHLSQELCFASAVSVSVSVCAAFTSIYGTDNPKDSEDAKADAALQTLVEFVGSLADPALQDLRNTLGPATAPSRLSIDM